MKKLVHSVAVALLVGSAMLVPTKDAQAFFGWMMPWNWFRGAGWDGYPYYWGGYPYWGYPYWGYPYWGYPYWGYPYWGGYHPYGWWGGYPYWGGYHPYGWWGGYPYYGPYGYPYPPRKSTESVKE